jgi:multiple antibiotic resistance protein
MAGVLGVAASWRVSSDDLRLAGGIFLFTAAREMIGQVGRPASPSRVAVDACCAIETICGHTACRPGDCHAVGRRGDLVFCRPCLRRFEDDGAVIGILLLIMVLNLVGMLLARQIIACVGMVTFQVLGWIFAVLQAGLAVDAIVTSVRGLAPFHVLS